MGWVGASMSRVHIDERALVGDIIKVLIVIISRIVNQEHTPGKVVLMYFRALLGK